MNFSDPIHQIAEICLSLGIENVVICPGSRSAPLTISFAKVDKINKHVIYDERSAAYIALGIALNTQKTVALICTSGTAAVNFYPAIAEAFWLKVPLLVLTGDRPPEWIGQGEGQAINQSFLYEKNIKSSYVFPLERQHKDAQWSLKRIVNEAVNKSQLPPKGPVHINVPFREPFYPEAELKFENSFQPYKIIKSNSTLDKENWNEIIKLLVENPKKILLCGQLLPDENFKVVLDSFLENSPFPVLTDINSNLQGLKNAISHYDLIFNISSDEDKLTLMPDLLITIGGELISKKIKQYFRNNKPKYHIHISEEEALIDTFQTVTHFVQVSPEYFFKELMVKVVPFNDKKFTNHWFSIQKSISSKVSSYLNESHFDELTVVGKVLESKKGDEVLHLANSMSVRYASIVGNKGNVFCNRGTSGIDGSISTAVGFAFSSNKLNLIITGDMSFLYDKNAFWHNYQVPNLRIVVINNGGGAIFRMVEGAKSQPELNQYFVTKQVQNCENICKDYDIDYQKVISIDELMSGLKYFFRDDEKAKLIEVFISNEQLPSDFSNFYQYLRSN